MAKKSLYDYEGENKKEKKTSKQKGNKEKRKVKNNTKPSNQIDSENEIIIGVTVHSNPKVEKNKKDHKKNEEEKSKKKKIKNSKRPLNRPANNKDKIHKQSINNNIIYNEYIGNGLAHEDKRTSKGKKIIRRTSIIVLIIGLIIFAMISPIFNAKQIKVTGNSKLTSEKIVGMSGLEIGQNVFRINKNEINKKLKQNGYIESVKIKRNIPDEIEIIIKERVPSFGIEYGNGYVIINNQGYILELSDERKEIPTLIGTSTPEEEYKEANRLNDQDLNNLNLVLKIMNAASSNGIESLISSIDFSDLNNIKINLESEKKIAYLGDCSNLVHRIQWVKTILENRQGVEGEIIVNMNLNIKDPYFRESIR